MMAALIIGAVGTGFMAGSVFAVTHEPPMVLLCILLGVPGFIGWALAFPAFNRILKKRTKELAPLIEKKLEEIHKICEQGHQLLDT